MLRTRPRCPYFLRFIFYLMTTRGCKSLRRARPQSRAPPAGVRGRRSALAGPPPRARRVLRSSCSRAPRRGLFRGSRRACGHERRQRQQRRCSPRPVRRAPPGFVSWVLPGPPARVRRSASKWPRSQTCPMHARASARRSRRSDTRRRVCGSECARREAAAPGRGRMRGRQHLQFLYRTSTGLVQDLFLRAFCPPDAPTFLRRERRGTAECAKNREDAAILLRLTHHLRLAPRQSRIAPPAPSPFASTRSRRRADVDNSFVVPDWDSRVACPTSRTSSLRRSGRAAVSRRECLQRPAPRATTRAFRPDCYLRVSAVISYSQAFWTRGRLVRFSS